MCQCSHSFICIDVKILSAAFLSPPPLQSSILTWLWLPRFKMRSQSLTPAAMTSKNHIILPQLPTSIFYYNEKFPSADKNYLPFDKSHHFQVGLPWVLCNDPQQESGPKMKESGSFTKAAQKWKIMEVTQKWPKNKNYGSLPKWPKNNKVWKSQTWKKNLKVKQKWP